MRDSVKVSVYRCNLYSGNPFLAEKDGKYHIMQGDMKEDDVKDWYDTAEEAAKRWNDRLHMSKLCGEAVKIAI